MLALALAVALIGLTLLALKLAGAVGAVVTGVLALNGYLLALAALRRPARAAPDVAAPDVAEGAEDAERWRPRSFRRIPEDADDERAPRLKVHRL